MMTVPTKSTPEKDTEWETNDCMDLHESAPEALSSKVCSVVQAQRHI